MDNRVSLLRFDILTTFPELFADTPGAVGGALNSSIPARARTAGIVEWHATNIRNYATDKHQKTDDRPFGGGPGMVMMCQPLWDAVHAVEQLDPRPATRILLTPQGRPLTQSLVEELAAKPRLLLIAGHYEGLDERVVEKLAPLEISIGDYVLSGGELGAMVLMDAIIRLLPGVLGHEDSASQDSFSQSRPHQSRAHQSRAHQSRAHQSRAAQAAGPPDPDPPRLLDCPHYTKPREWMGVPVPDILLSGDHGAIQLWRDQQRAQRTRERRPDLLGQ